MKPQSVDKLFQSSLGDASTMPRPELWEQLDQELNLSSRKRGSRLWIKIASVAAVLALTWTIVPFDKSPVGQIEFSSLPVMVYQSEFSGELNTRPMTLKSQVIRGETSIREELVYTSDVEIPENDSDYLPVSTPETLVVSASTSMMNIDAEALLFQVEVELEDGGAAGDYAQVDAPTTLLRISPESLLEEAERADNGNKFGKKILDKLKVGVDGIGSVIAQRNQNKQK
ncbi:MAG: hypothetical protein ACPGRE_07565 [Flavobacteriaceae bacterium]